MAWSAALVLSPLGGVAQERTPLQRGPHRVERAILGMTPGTTRVPVT